MTIKTETFVVKNKEYIIYIGKNKYNNFELINISEPTDIWFHAHEGASCHVILKNEDVIRNIPHTVIKRCALLCKIHSKFKYNSCSIMYTYLEYVHKTDVIGQVNVDEFKLITI